MSRRSTSTHYSIKRGSPGWKRRYEGVSATKSPSALGEGPVCEHGPECHVRELWPLDGETHAQFLARLKSTDWVGKAARTEATTS